MSRDPELTLCLEALGIRFGRNGIQTDEVATQIKGKTEKASHAAMSRLVNGTVELSTIQVFCLLSHLEFTSKMPKISKVHT